MDILFNGVGIDCSSEEFEAASFCGAMQNEKAIKVVNETYLKFSILGGVSNELFQCRRNVTEFN